MIYIFNYGSGYGSNSDTIVNKIHHILSILDSVYHETLCEHIKSFPNFMMTRKFSKKYHKDYVIYNEDKFSLIKEIEKEKCEDLFKIYFKLIDCQKKFVLIKNKISEAKYKIIKQK